MTGMKPRHPPAHAARVFQAISDLQNGACLTIASLRQKR